MDTSRHNQNDRESRIQARRRRVQERMLEMREGEKPGDKKSEQSQALGLGKQQMLESRRKLLKLAMETGAKVRGVRLGADDAEMQHRELEENVRQELRAMLLSEAETSARQNAAVAMRWADLFCLEVPQELYLEIEKQRAACSRIIGSKDQLIENIKTELRRKDDEYVKLLKRQAEDIDLLLKYMGEQFQDVQCGIEQELQSVEEAFLQERQNLLESNRKELQAMFDMRSKMEQDFMDRYLAQVADYQGQLDNLYVQDAEEYNVLKIRLESDIQNLEQHLESMRSTYQLNTEKLEYNYRVLVERDHENQSTINQQKRKIGRQRDMLSNLKTRYTETDRKYQEENTRLTDEYKRITDQFKDLQTKFRHFEMVDLRRYQDIWKMKEEEVIALSKQVLAADRLLHEQQLGWEWRPPNSAALVSPHAVPAAAAGGREGEREGAGGLDAKGGSDEEDEAAAGEAAKQEFLDRLESERNRGALSMLCSEAGFLVDTKARKLIEALPQEQHGMVRAEAILRALGITDGPTFDALLEALSPNSDIELRATGVQPSAVGVEGKEALKLEPVEGSTLVLVHPDDAVRRLKAFVEAENLAPNKGSGGAGAARVSGVSRRVVEKEKEYWHTMSNVVNDNSFRVWTALEKNLQGYLGLLRAREKSLRGLESQLQQNRELRHLLSTYLSSRINEELHIPPAKII